MDYGKMTKEGLINELETLKSKLKTFENRQLEGELYKQARISMLGADVGKALTMPESLRTMLKMCTEALVKHLDVSFARIWTLNNVDNMLELRASAGLYTHIDGPHSRVPVGSLKIGLIAQEQEPHLTNDVMNDPRVSDREWARREGIVAFAGYPLIVEDRLVGVMAMFACQPLSRETMDALASVSDQIALGTERKRGEEKILKLSRVVEQSPIIVIITDTKGNIEYVNPKFTQVTGYSFEEVLGQNTRILRSGKTLPEVYKELWSTLTSGNEWRGELCNKKKNGKLFWASASISPLENDKGEISHFIAVQDDITEKKKMEAALLQSEKLKSIGTIAAGVAHEFNNILATISGKTQLLEMDYENHKELTDELRIIRKASDDGAKISSKMIKFSKIQKDTTGFALYDVRDLIKNAIDFTMPRWKNMAQAKGKKYYIDTEGIKKIPLIQCNLTEIRGVFTNIIINAMDAMPDGGRLSFSTWSEEDLVFISISDTGEGMHEEVKKNIFDPFFTTKIAVGTGLGLSMAYGIMTKHGGKIEVESEVGKGSTFTLQFPAAIKDACQIATPEPEQEAKSENIRILVVDDEEVICNMLDKFLSGKGHKVKIVNNGTGAIELTKVEGFDLVLCDLAMPDIFGYDVIKALNELEKRPKIGLITGWGERLKPIDEEGMKVDFIIKKPFDFSELTKHINDAMSVG